MSKIFPLLLFTVAVLIAGTAAFFSVKGIGLLFAGSFLPVVVMAGSLEIGKLFAVSFLYRKWKDMAVMLKIYLSAAVTLLIAITSLGIFGFLSDAYQDTKNKVNYIDTKILALQEQNKEIQSRIQAEKERESVETDDNSVKSERYKQIYDSYVEQKNKTKQTILDRLAQLDAELDKVKSKQGGLFSNKQKDIDKIQTQQQEERLTIKANLDKIQDDIAREYDNFINKVDQLSKIETSSKPIDMKQLYGEIETNNQEILQLKKDIHQTDIGSFKFIADAIGVEVDTAVKWFILMIVIVFDPLAMCLIIGYNMYVTNDATKRKLTKSIIPTTHKIK